MIGKWHLGYCRKELLPTERGFDYFYGYYGPQTGYFNHSAGVSAKGERTRLAQTNTIVLRIVSCAVSTCSRKWKQA